VSVPAPVRFTVLPRALSVAAAGIVTTAEEEPLSKARATWTKLPGSKVSVLARRAGVYLVSGVDDAGELEIDVNKVRLSPGEYDLEISRDARTAIGAPFGGGEAVSRFVDHVQLVVTEAPR